MADDSSAKTHDPTPRRREEFRKQGNFARARDAGPILSTAAALGILVAMRGATSRAIETIFTHTHGDLTAIVRGDSTEISKLVYGTLLALIAPIAFAAAAGGIVAGLAQSGLRFYGEMFVFKPERLNPLPKLGQMFGFKNAAKETAIATARVGLIGYIAYSTLVPEIPNLLTLTSTPVSVSFDKVTDTILRLIIKVLGAMLVLAVLDYIQSRYALEQQMKMSLQEIKEESKSSEGDPKVKARMRARAKQAAKRRMMSDIKKADAVVTNPTHIAVALRYSDKDYAPVVIAKGHDEVALQIRAEARRYGIPIIENRPLARALDAEVELGRAIPGIHYAAVAQILAFVFRLKGRRMGGPARARS